MYCCFLLCLPLTVGSPFSFFSFHYFLTWAPTTTLLFLFSPQIKVVGKSCVFLQQLENKILFIKAKLYVLLQKLENKIYFIKASAFSPPPSDTRNTKRSVCVRVHEHMKQTRSAKSSITFSSDSFLFFFLPPQSCKCEFNQIILIL